MASQLDPPTPRVSGDDQRGRTTGQSAGGQQAPLPTASTSLDSETIEGVKRANPLLTVLGRYGIAVQGTGAHRMARCPFHDDKRPSLGVFLDTNRFFCFGCGANGDVIALVQRLEAIGFREAIRRLAQAQTPTEASGGVPMTRRLESRLTRWPITPRPIRPDTTGSQSLLPRALQQPALHVLENTPSEESASRRVTTSQYRREAATYPSIDLALLTAGPGIYQATLHSSQPARGYLRRRGIPPSIAQEAHIGYADGVSLLHYLGHDDELLRAAHRIGLLNDHGQERLRGRLIIPEFRAGLCIWLHGRLVDCPPSMTSAPSPPSQEGDMDGADSHRPLLPVKYLGCALPKPLFGVGLCEQDRAEAKRRGTERPALLVVEGAFDVLAVRALCLPMHCVALIGTHAGPTQRRELLQLADRGPIWLALDADAAGDVGGERLAAWLCANGYPAPIQRIRPPCGAKDLAELVELVGQRGARKAFVDMLRLRQQLTGDDVTPSSQRNVEADAQVGSAHADGMLSEPRRSGRSTQAMQGGRDEEGDGGGQ